MPATPTHDSTTDSPRLYLAFELAWMAALAWALFNGRYLFGSRWSWWIQALGDMPLPGLVSGGRWRRALCVVGGGSAAAIGIACGSMTWTHSEGRDASLRRV